MAELKIRAIAHPLLKAGVDVTEFRYELWVGQKYFGPGRVRHNLLWIRKGDMVVFR